LAIGIAIGARDRAIIFLTLEGKAMVVDWPKNQSKNTVNRA